MSTKLPTSMLRTINKLQTRVEAVEGNIDCKIMISHHLIYGTEHIVIEDGRIITNHTGEIENTLEEVHQVSVCLYYYNLVDNGLVVLSSPLAKLITEFEQADPFTWGKTTLSNSEGELGVRIDELANVA